MSAEKFLESIRLLIVAALFFTFVYYAVIYGKVFSYNFFYEGKVKETISETVKSSCLKSRT